MMSAPIASLKSQPPPAFSDIAKAANDLINKDFYHNAASLFEVKLKTSNGVEVTTRGSTSHDSITSASIEAKQTVSKGVQLSLSSSSSKLLTMKAELDDLIAQGVKAELQSNHHLEKGGHDTKLALFFKHPSFHTRSFVDYTPNGRAVHAVVDGVVGHENFLLGGEAGYNVHKAALTRYSAVLGYHGSLYSAAVAFTNHWSLAHASFYQKARPNVEVGIRAAYDLKNTQQVGIEVASKYKIDPLSFAKVKLNERGIASISYNTKVNSGFTFGIGTSFDTSKFSCGNHKIGASFSFVG